MPSKFSIILADPPWPYFSHFDKRQPFAENHYSLMSEEDIYSMPVLELADDSCILFIWATGPKLDLGIECMRRWGFHYRGVASVWVKTRKDGGVLNGSGPRPSLVKPVSEFLLWGSLKKKGRPLPIALENVPNQILAPRGPHSAKPEIFQDYIDKLLPGYSRLELFARRQRDGWVCTGSELTGHDYTKGVLI